MAPFHLFTKVFDTDLPAAAFSMQWQSPGDVFSVLLLLGGEVISRALAQVAGTESLVAPVAFSFGWVAFSVTALLSAVGENKLMPAPDISCRVINGRSGYARDNSSWLIGRLVRDFEYWMPAQTKNHLQSMLDQRWEADKASAARKQLQQQQDEDKQPPNSHLSSTKMLDSTAATTTTTPRPTRTSLCVTVLAAAADRPAHPAPVTHDLAHLIGLATLLVQLCVASIPAAVWGDWAVLAVTGAGAALAAATAALPQWRRERWGCCRRRSDKAVVLTRGNGAQHALVVLGEGRGLDLEDLAAAAAAGAGAGQMHGGGLGEASRTGTVGAVGVLCALWVGLLVSAAGLRAHSWFLVVVGGIGMVQNVYVAGARRGPEAAGVPLEFREVVGEAKVFDTLLEVERRYPRVGKSMLDTFFPGGHLTREERARWSEVEAEVERG
ncbi:uncharacterized protein BKCO1_900040 [Diplodia corticola]|uniref:Uncharacterized protein n=1 Tax=Diplodia corticola TaxID=236234 RepID=A0A1J9R5U2_9PEZI|nr:uncharacterized protein BKCO1_900040 [Diplodia corticola]OJD36886.1 hypothetical protein BKCO1_900040 [Diplodia corticola]